MLLTHYLHRNTILRLFQEKDLVMKHATLLPADAGIGSNDKDLLARAEQADERGPVRTVHQRVQSGAIKSTAAYGGEGWRKGVGPKFPQGA